ncbi:helicase-like protein [Jatrophihabitans sp. GAS493]|uniref:DEAD/DEAH box helicase n=1 Tax=Jatrophihabitans sp. GAS493 TaxID=1907575 RepID=UPI000BB8A31A|nr:DEAD/DEAH box helicase [Jatrophihabitans sp. GAS493]SOD72750.1 helicase-like protein [Jatrophihabitans sp. GAS493]
MTAAVHAEIAADGQRIVLIAAGAIEDIAFTAKQLQQTTPLFKTSNPKGALLCPLTWAAVVQLAAVYGPAWRPGPNLQTWITEQISARTADLTTPLRAPIPDGYTPRPYQVEGANMIAATGHTLITDEPGTGKTITTILGLIELWGRSMNKENPSPMPILVICPASVVDPWVQAFRDWIPFWRTAAWRGSPKRRRGLIGEADVYVTSYDTARMDAKDTNPAHSPLIELDPRALVADECHLIKNHHAARSAAVRRIARNAKAFVALSGTPITHHPADLWPTLTCLAPGAWPSRERWVNRYCLSVPADYGETILGLHPGNEPEFRTTLLGQQRRVAKADVLDQLPPKVYSVRAVELPPAYRKAYDAMENDMLAQMPDGGELSVMSVLAQMTRLSQLASAAAEVTTTTEINDSGEQVEHVSVTLTNPSWKVDAMLEICAERPDQQVVAFAPSAQLMRLAGESAAKAGLRVGYVIGGQSMKDRTETVEKFQGGHLDLICATTGAGGVGITLTAASTVVFLQRPWSLVESIQAEDRAHRIGSERHESIEIVDIVALDTLDTRVRAVLRERAGQLSALVQDPRIVAELLGGASVHPLRKKAS